MGQPIRGEICFLRVVARRVHCESCCWCWPVSRLQFRSRPSQPARAQTPSLVLFPGARRRRSLSSGRVSSLFPVRPSLSCSLFAAHPVHHNHGEPEKAFAAGSGRRRWSVPTAEPSLTNCVRGRFQNGSESVFACNGPGFALVMEPPRRVSWYAMTYSSLRAVLGFVSFVCPW